MPRVSEVMVSDVVTIDSSASIIDAARKMISEEKGPLPVMEGDSLRAMITDRGTTGGRGEAREEQVVSANNGRRILA
jgi:predicted transcriptional regulator